MFRFYFLTLSDTKTLIFRHLVYQTSSRIARKEVKDVSWSTFLKTLVSLFLLE